jgi:predicted nucleotide-binding protein (sugar kinase/HSP70/actin superfamily)
MYVEDKENQQKDNNCTCAFLNTEPFYLKAAYKEDYPHLLDKMITPYINFSHGFGTQEEAFVKVARQMGVTDESKIRVAYKYAVQVQQEYTQELYSIGREFMKMLEENPDTFAIVLTGRPYNSFTDIANKGIPQKFASRGIYVVPYDIFDYREKPIDDLQYWESGKKILKTAKLVKEHPQLFSTYVSNFSCAPDSMIMTSFRSIMGSKPSLTLELDGHTADSGINTRIDAALDIIRNYLKIKKGIKDVDYSDFKAAYVKMSATNAKYVCSDGSEIPLKDPSVKILVPAMGDLSARMFAATFRHLGFNAEALPDTDWDVLKYGRAHTTGKECLPLILCVGSMIDYLENRWDGKEKIAFFLAQGSGDCRLGQYPVFMRDLIRRKKLKNVTPFALAQEEGFAGLGPNFAKIGVQGLLAADILDDVRSAIMANAEDPDHGLKILYEEFEKLESVFQKDPAKIFSQLEILAKSIKEKVPARIPIEDSKYIALVGEMYVRRDGFAHKWLNKYFAKKGFVLKDAYITEWLFYLDYLTKRGYIQPGKSLKNKWERFIRHYFMRRYEVQMKKIMEKSGYYQFQKIDVEGLLKRSEHLVPLEFRGEPGLTLGVGLHETIKDYCGVVNVGPFGCMPTRFSEALGNQEMKVKHKVEAERIVDPKFKLSEIFNGEMNIPFLTIESDGNVYPQIIEARLETFTLQAERMAGLMKEMYMNGGYNGHKKKL